MTLICNNCTGQKTDSTLNRMKLCEDELVYKDDSTLPHIKCHRIKAAPYQTNGCDWTDPGQVC